jgi:hypothetical protein
MGMDEVVKGVVRDSINDRLDMAEKAILNKVDGMIARAKLGAGTDADEDRRQMFRTRLETAETIKDIILVAISETKVR